MSADEKPRNTAARKKTKIKKIPVPQNVELTGEKSIRFISKKGNGTRKYFRFGK